MSNTCNIPIQNIAESDSCGNNQSGVTGIYFCPKADVVSINAARPATITSYEDRVTIGSSSLATNAISCATNKGFAKMFCADDLGELVYTPQGQHGSRSFKAELEVFHPAFKADILGFMTVHNNQELIIVAEMNNGEFHLLGKCDLARPAAVSHRIKKKRFFQSFSRKRLIGSHTSHLLPVSYCPY